MNKKTSLENLIFNSGMTNKEFAEKVGVPLRTLQSQIYTKKNHIKYAFEYGRILGVNMIQGFENGVYFELVIK